MKVYLVFCGHNYYPSRFDDYCGTFADYDLAFNFLLEKASNADKYSHSSDYFDWAEIIEVTESESRLVFSNTIDFLKNQND